MRRIAVVLAAVAVLGICGSGCKAKRAAQSRRETIWRPLGTWSGQGRIQTESFNGESGALRIKWAAKNAKADGRFELTIHSAISGRPMGTVVEHAGNGDGTAYFSDDPHVFFAVVDAKNLDWTFTIDEPVDVIVTPK